MHYWFRNHYNLAPLDPRYLEMTEDGILREYETFLALNGNKKVECPRCHYTTFRDTCFFCTDKAGNLLALTGAREIDDVERRLEAGEDVDLTEFFSAKKDVEFAEKEDLFEKVEVDDIGEGDKP